ncbi:unnamed protein product [Didymodactylos carnosus]|uniref:Uncharacterized protein n=1 Tax=Didymodactylos carnosus TaxID=1234261 RepID=A0A814V6R9_9BILA|nr:unnamed protein product [Didymodactylos carnosus]CAF3947744.1 unnamed protein product [Didymodactylos carnosus]
MSTMNNNNNNQMPLQQQQQQQPTPSQLQLNDFIPPQLRDPSPNVPNVPLDFNLAATTTANNIPRNALPQRQNFATTNTTQPFTMKIKSVELVCWRVKLHFLRQIISFFQKQ